MIVPLRRYLSSSLATDDRSLFHRPLEKRGNRDSSSSALRLVLEADKQKRATHSFSLFFTFSFFYFLFFSYFVSFSRKSTKFALAAGEREKEIAILSRTEE